MFHVKPTFYIYTSMFKFWKMYNNKYIYINIPSDTYTIAIPVFIKCHIQNIKCTDTCDTIDFIYVETRNTYKASRNIIS